MNELGTEVCFHAEMGIGALHLHGTSKILGGVFC